jgi:denticleless
VETNAYAELLDIDALSAEGDSTLPFALKFASTAQAARKFVVADEEGSMSLFELSEDDSSAHALRWHHAAHSNAIFDVAWLASDSQLLTASGDQTCRLWDLQTVQCLATARGHTGSIKSVATRESSPYLFATGGRDGCVMLWDSRMGSARSELAPALQIPRAHTTHSKGGRKRARMDTHSVTSVNFLPWEHALASAGASDGCAAAVATRPSPSARVRAGIERLTRAPRLAPRRAAPRHAARSNSGICASPRRPSISATSMPRQPAVRPTARARAATAASTWICTT